MTGFGVLLIILGVGSLLLPMLNLQFTLMEFVDPYQPWAGILVAVIGAALVGLGLQRSRAAAAPTASAPAAPVASAAETPRPAPAPAVPPASAAPAAPAAPAVPPPVESAAPGAPRPDRGRRGGRPASRHEPRPSLTDGIGPTSLREDVVDRRPNRVPIPAVR